MSEEKPFIKIPLKFPNRFNYDSVRDSVIEHVNSTNQPIPMGVGYELKDVYFDLEETAGFLNSVELTESDEMVGDFRILETPKGVVAKSLLDSEIEVEAFLTGLGQVDENWCISEYSLISVDLRPKN